MSITLTSAFLKLTLEPEKGSFSLSSMKHDDLSFQDARTSLRFHQQGIHKLFPGDAWKVTYISEPIHEVTRKGLIERVDLISKTDSEGVQLHLSFALMQDKPLGLMQMGIKNLTSLPVNLERLTLMDLRTGGVRLNSHGCDPAFYSNGWQSWSPTATYRQGQKQQRSKFGFLSEPMILNKGTTITRQANHFSSDMFGALVDLSSRQGLLVGFLSQKQHFGSLETRFIPQPTLKVWANGDMVQLLPDHSIFTDWLCFGFLDIDAPKPFQHYFQAVNLENEVIPRPEVPVGWCSWYHYFTKVSENDLSVNLNAMVKLRNQIPMQLFQIDDGFESAVGDWFSFNDRFPRGVKILAHEIKSKGVKPGLWLAPFIVQSGAKLLKDHRDWMLRNKNGRPVNAGFAWNNLATALDLTIPAALNYVKEVIHTAVHEWGFQYLKLDFLYAAALGGEYLDDTLTRAQVLRLGLEAIREAAGEETTLLACGCPVGSALGLFDMMRISADVAPTWLPAFGNISSIFKDEPNMPSAKNAIQNILTRASMDKFWWRNDPDCLLIRPDSKLTLAEVQSLASAIAITGGALLLSDNLSCLSPERLEIAQMLVPIIDSRCRVLDLFENTLPEKVILPLEGPCRKWQIMAAFNWQDSPQDILINADLWGLDHSKTFIGRELWTGQAILFSNTVTIQQIPAHGVAFIALRQFDPSSPCYIGSNLHISQGLEVHKWVEEEDSLQISMALPRHAKGQVFLYLPEEPQSITVDDLPIVYKRQNSHFYELDLEFEFSAEIKISY